MKSELSQAAQVRDEKQYKRMQEELAHQSGIIQKAMRNLAVAATDLQHGKPELEQAAAALESRARKIGRSVAKPPEPEGPVPGATPVQEMVVQEMRMRRRPAPPADDQGFKLSHFQMHSWDDLVHDLQAHYKSVGINKERYSSVVAHRTCELCPPEWSNMPHREGHCPSAHAGTNQGRAKMGTERADRVLQRLLARQQTGGDSRIALMQAAAALDASYGDDGVYIAACDYFLNTRIEDDAAEREYDTEAVLHVAQFLASPEDE